MVGTSGSVGDRFGLITASPRTLPPRMLGAAVDSAGKLIGVWPPTVEFIAGPPPVNGTWMMSTP